MDIKNTVGGRKSRIWEQREGTFESISIHTKTSGLCGKESQILISKERLLILLASNNKEIKYPPFFHDGKRLPPLCVADLLRRNTLIT